MHVEVCTTASAAGAVRCHLTTLRRSRPSAKGLVDSPDDPEEWARRSQAKNTLRMAGLQLAVTHADTNARAAAVFAALEANTAGQASQLQAAALSGMACRRSCAGALADGSAGCLGSGAHGCRAHPERGGALALLPRLPIVADLCVTHPLSASAVKAAARGTGATVTSKDWLKRVKYSRTGTGARRFVPLRHETFRRAGPVAFAVLNEIAEFVASSGAVSKRLILENAMSHLSTSLCCGITRQVLATVPLRARLNGHPLVAGLPVPADDLIPVAGGPPYLPHHPLSNPITLP